MSFAASKLYLLDHAHCQAILVPDEDGVPTFIEPQPIATRAVYLNADKTEPTDIQQAQVELRTGQTLLV